MATTARTTEDLLGMSPNSYADRARYFSSAEAFDLKLPKVPCVVFEDEANRAFAKASPSQYIPMDLSAQLQIQGPCTAPLVLAGYARVNAGDTLDTHFISSGELWYAIEGAGVATNSEDEIAFNVGDLFCFPGGATTTIKANSRCVLWAINNQPQLKMEGLVPPAREDSLIETVHYPAAATQQELDRIYSLATDEDTAGLAVVYSHQALDRLRNVMPSLTIAMNSLPPGGMQRPHRHNSVALTLCVQGKDCYSMIDGERVDWQPNTVMVTPPTAVHSHHNDGDERMTCLIVQDGGLYYHARTMGFSFAD